MTTQELRAAQKPPAAHPTPAVSQLQVFAQRAPWELALIVVAMIPNLIWILRDYTPWPWDQAWYGEVSVDLWFDLTHTLRYWFTAMLLEMNMKAPGVVWLGQVFVPVRHLLGSVENALLLSVVLTQAVTLYLIFRIGRALAPESKAVAALGVCTAAGMQGFIGLSHQFFVEPLQALAVAWMLLIAVRCTEWPGRRTVTQLVGALTVSLLAKATTPLYCLLPCLYVCYVLFRNRFWRQWKSQQPSIPDRILAVAVILALPPTITWYALNLKIVWQHIREASSGSLAIPYAFHGSIATKLMVWLRLFDLSFVAPYLGWVFLIAVLWGSFAWLRASQRTRPGQEARFNGNLQWTASENVVAILSIVQCVLMLLVFSDNDMVESRFMYAIFPLLLLIAMSFSAPIRSWIPFAAMFALCALQWYDVHRVSLGVSPPIAKQLNWIFKPNQDANRYRDVERVIATSSTVSGRYNIVGIEEPWLNANTLAFFAAKHRLDTGIRSYYTSLGYAESDVKTAVDRVHNFHIMYYITLDENFQAKPPNFVNLVTLPVLKEIKTDPGFEEVGSTDSNGVILFRSR